MIEEKCAKNPESVRLKPSTIDNIEKEHKRVDRSKNYLMRKAIELVYGKDNYIGDKQ